MLGGTRKPLTRNSRRAATQYANVCSHTRPLTVNINQREEAEAKKAAPVLMLGFVPLRFPGSSRWTTYGPGESHVSRGVTETRPVRIFRAFLQATRFVHSRVLR